MKRLLLLLVVGVAVALLGPGIASASASSCSPWPGSGDGEQAPQFYFINGTQNGIEGSTYGGYSCTVNWQEVTTLQYGNGGVWHVDNDGAYNAGINRGIFAANVGHQWLEPPTGITNPLPACAYNWRFRVDLYTSGGVNIVSHFSPTLHLNC